MKTSIYSIEVKLIFIFLLLSTHIKAQEVITTKLDSVQRGDMDSLSVKMIPQMPKQDSLKIKRIVPELHIIENDTSDFENLWKYQGKLNKNETQHIIYINMGDELSYLPGFYNFNLGIPGQLATVSQRGTQTNWITFLLDGRPMKDPHTNLIDLNIIPVESIKQ